ncbi:hypothetical protein [Fundidesulfovibrio agrisoli]|uniref:hypothetical protein n=1 Tax=Fundidesulfovibrio agrisoli TaxID=2922717 RepID=UPI001FAD74E9|nr:hypothetical protein [Fundidesulfovibrio agrisoli]
MLTSILPGRIRARLEPGFPEHALQALRAALGEAVTGVTLKHNPRSNSLLITYPPGPGHDRAVRKTLEERLAPAAPCAKRSLAWPSMRSVKRGMAASLGLALAALALRNERAHAWAGGAFAALLARHLYVYRKRLFK